MLLMWMWTLNTSPTSEMRCKEWASSLNNIWKGAFELDVNSLPIMFDSLSTECEDYDWILMQPLNGTRTHERLNLYRDTLHWIHRAPYTQGEAASESENQGLTSMKRMSAKESRSQRCVKIVQCNSNNCIHLLPRYYFFEQYYFLQITICPVSSICISTILP